MKAESEASKRKQVSGSKRAESERAFIKRVTQVTSERETHKALANVSKRKLTESLRSEDQRIRDREMEDHEIGRSRAT